MATMSASVGHATAHDRLMEQSRQRPPQRRGKNSYTRSSPTVEASMLIKSRTKKRAFKVTSTKAHGQVLLVVANSHTRAKALALKHFEGSDYTDLRVRRESILYDIAAITFRRNRVITSNSQLPDGVEYYRELPSAAKRGVLGVMWADFKSIFSK